MPVDYLTKKAGSMSDILHCRQTGWRDNTVQRQYPRMLSREPAASLVGGKRHVDPLVIDMKRG
jgi:hypothetical protein